MPFLSDISDFFEKKKRDPTAIQIKPVEPIQIKSVGSTPPKRPIDTAMTFFRGGAEALPFAEKIKTGVAKHAETKFPQLKVFGKKLRTDYGFDPYEEPVPPATPLEKGLYVGGAVVSNIGQFVLAGRMSKALLSPIFKYTIAGLSAGRYGYSALEGIKLVRAAEKAAKLSVQVTNPILNGAVQWGIFQAGHLTSTTLKGQVRELTTSMVTGGAFGKLALIPEMKPVIKYLASSLAPFIIKSTIGGKPDEALGDLPSYALMSIPFLMGGLKKVPHFKTEVPVVPAVGPGFLPPTAGVVAPPAVVPLEMPLSTSNIAPPPATVVPGGVSEAIVPKQPSVISLEQAKTTFINTIEDQLRGTVVEGRSDVFKDATFTSKTVDSKTLLPKPIDSPEVVKQWEQKISAGERPLVLTTTTNGEVNVVDGNHKLHAYKNLGITQIPTINALMSVVSEKAPTMLDYPRRDGKGNLVDQYGKKVETAWEAMQVYPQPPVGEGKITPQNILQKIAIPKNGPQGIMLTPEEINVLSKYLNTTDTSGLRGTIYKKYGGGQDIVFGTIKDRQWKGQTEYLVMADSGVNKGMFRLHSTHISSSEITGKISLNNFFPSPHQGVISSGPKTTLKKVEKEIAIERFKSYLNNSKDKEDYVKRVAVLKEQANKPETRANVKKLREVKALVNKELQNLTGNISTGNYKRDFAFYQIVKSEPGVADQVNALEDLLVDVDDAIGNGKIRKDFATAERDLSLPDKGEYFITYGKYSTKGTRNREWVQENIPLLYMGNKRGMLGYILDVLGIKQKDLGSLGQEDVTHLNEVTNVVDLFGGSGLMSNLSKKFFPNAKITYNELDPKTLEAIELAKTNPKEVGSFVAQIGSYIRSNPGADWVAHFKTVYKGDEKFRVAAKLLEAAGGRTGEITKNKIRNILKAIPNFSKIFKNISISNQDALGLMDEYGKTGSPKDMLWIDPPYIWSSGYNVGLAMEGAEGFVSILDKLRKLNDRGVNFVFFNNDPEVQVAKAGTQGVHLTNIMGKINQLSMDGITVIKDIHPIGTTDRREMMITNMPFGLESGRLLNIVEVQKAIVALKDDPMGAPKELLKLFRDIRGSSRFVSDSKSLTKHQKNIIVALKKALRIRNKEMTPMMDELLGDVSLSKMTTIDGQQLIEWLQPRNFEVIENKIALTRQMNATEKHKAILGELFAAKDVELEGKFGVLGAMNKTVQEMDNLVKLIELTPLPKENKSVIRRVMAGLVGRFVSEDLATSLIGIKESFHTPMRSLINISNNHTNRMKKSLTSVFAGLSKEDKKQVVFIQAGAEKSIERPISPTAKKVADYLQEVSEANIALINRIRVARGQSPLVGRKPYIPYIIAEDLQMAANLFDRNKFWEARIKTPKDFVAGLFTHDPERIIDVWSESMGNWLKKNLYGSLLADRVDSLFKVNDGATAYAREMVMLDIYDQLPDSEKLYRTVGSAVNEALGKIWPKKIKIDTELAQSVLNTVFGQELRKDIAKGYISIPQIQAPNIATAFHKLFYPAKLAWNFGFGLLNLQQPWSGMPFVGSVNKLRGRLATFFVILPFNGKFRAKYTSFLEGSGYQFGRIIEGTELASVKGKIGNMIDRSINFIGDMTEFSNRMESMMEASWYLGGLEKKFGVKLSESDKLKIAARYSAFINFISGKGYSPLGQRSTVGKFFYIFQQYPINQMNIYFEQWKYATKDEGVKKFWQMMTTEAGASEEAFRFFDNLKKTGRFKTMGLIFLSLLAMVMPVATLYVLARNWNIASRGLPAVPRVVASDLITAVTEYTNDPSTDTLAKLNQAIKQFFAITTKSRLKDALDIYDAGMIQSGVSKKPIFVQQNLNNMINVLIFGRSSLGEYSKRYPTWLQTLMTGQSQAGELASIRKDRANIQEEETQIAFNVVKKLKTAKKGSDIIPYITELKKSGKWNDRISEKVQQYLEDMVLDRGGMEHAIINLKDSDQARFVYNQLKRIKTGPEAIQKIAEFKRLGILTDNVKEELRILLKQEQLLDLGGVEIL